MFTRFIVSLFANSAAQLRVKVGAGVEKSALEKEGAGSGAEFCKMLVLVLYDVGSIYLG
jgi:hypothetical protein